MKYKVIKFIMILFLIVIFINICSPTVSASAISDVIQGGDKFINGASSGSKINESVLKKVSSDVYNILLSVAIIVDLTVGIVIGSKLMTSEAENKAEAKKSLIVFVIGSIIVFGAFGIWKTLVTLLNTI